MDGNYKRHGVDRITNYGLFRAHRCHSELIEMKYTILHSTNQPSTAWRSDRKPARSCTTIQQGWQLA